MRITDRHDRILRTVMAFSAAKDSLGGCAAYQVGTTPGVDRALKAMARAGLVEEFRTREKVRHGCHLNPDGHLLYRVAARGAAYLLDVAHAHERRSLEHRMALRVAGVPPHAIREAKAVLCKRHKGHVPYDVRHVAQEAANIFSS